MQQGEDPLDIGSSSALNGSRSCDLAGTMKHIANSIKPNLYSHTYVSSYINRKLKKIISTLAKGVSISNVYNSDLRTLEIINLPLLSEQIKISSFLSLLNEKISTQSKIIQRLESLMKGFTMNILKQKIRFKNVQRVELQILGNWKKIKSSLC